MIRFYIYFRYDGLEFGLRGESMASTERLFADGRASGFNHVVRGRILAGNYFLLKDKYEEYFEQARFKDIYSAAASNYYRCTINLNRHSKYEGLFLRILGALSNPA